MHRIGNRRPLTAALTLAALAAALGTASAQTLTTIRANGSPANRVDLVVIGDGYTQSELVKYDTDVDAFIAGLFGQSPFAEYRNHFNVHRVDLASAESGADHPARNPPVFKNTALDGTFDCSGIQRLTCVSLSKVNTVLSGIQPDMRDLVLVLLNDPEYGGSGGAVAVASIHPDVIEVILHEFGHTLGLLADEYGGPPPPVCSTAVEPVEPNATRATGLPVKWGVWIDPGTPLPTPFPVSGIPGLYEGAKYCDAGLYRPTFNSKMRSLFRPFEQINAEQLVKRIYNFASPIDDVVPVSSSISFTRDQSQTLRVATIQPIGHELDIVWTVDGIVAASGLDLSLIGSSLAAGTHTVEVLVTDRTPLVRNDPNGLLSDSRRWTVTVTGGASSTATAAFVRVDTATQGTWRGTYGRDGATVVTDAAGDPAYARTAPSGEATYAWEPFTADGRALQRITDASRVAATWYGDAFSIDVNLTDGQPHQLALYSVDWDHGGRAQRVDVRDAVTGALLDSRAQVGFDNGQYLVWHVTGHVVIHLTRLGGYNAVVSGLFLDPITVGGGSGATATFVRTDTGTQGTWRGTYGRDGATVVTDAAGDPAYARTAPSGEATYAWETFTTDGRALQRITDSSRVAATWYGDAFSIDVNLTDGQPHQLALYSVDWDHGGRAQRVDVRDAITGALLDSRTQAGFDNGQYLVWHVTGHVVIQLTHLGGYNAVVSGLFLDPIAGGSSTATATFFGVDATTKGTWQGVYGHDGATVVTDAAVDPAYARTAPSGEATYAWEPFTADGRALQRITDGSRVAATWYGDAFSIDVNLTDGQPHQLALYSVDWDHGGRVQRVDVRDGVTGALLDSRTQSGFDDGQYLVWQLTGHVVIQLTRLDGYNAVVSGLFLDPATSGSSAASAAFVRVDAATQGTWRGTYGRDGATVVSDAGGDPAYARTAPSGEATYAWETITSDGRALQRLTDDSRVAATWYGDVFSIYVNLTDGRPHQLALYTVDWDRSGRVQRVDVVDAVTGALLDTRTQSAFDDGQYLVWRLTGRVVIQLTRLAGYNAVVSGLFLDTVDAPLISMMR